MDEFSPAPVCLDSGLLETNFQCVKQLIRALTSEGQRRANLQNAVVSADPTDQYRVVSHCFHQPFGPFRGGLLLRFIAEDLEAEKEAASLNGPKEGILRAEAFQGVLDRQAKDSGLFGELLVREDGQDCASHRGRNGGFLRRY